MVVMYGFLIGFPNAPRRCIAVLLCSRRLSLFSLFYPILYLLLCEMWASEIASSRLTKVLSACQSLLFLSSISSAHHWSFIDHNMVAVVLDRSKFLVKCASSCVSGDHRRLTALLDVRDRPAAVRESNRRTAVISWHFEVSIPREPLCSRTFPTPDDLD